MPRRGGGGGRYLEGWLGDGCWTHEDVRWAAEVVLETRARAKAVWRGVNRRTGQWQEKEGPPGRRARRGMNFPKSLVLTDLTPEQGVPWWTAPASTFFDLGACRYVVASA